MSQQPTPTSYDPVRAVTYGWTGLTRNLTPFLVLGVAMFVVAYAVPTVLNVVTTGSVFGFQGASATADVGVILAGELVKLAWSLVSAVVCWVLGLAMMRGALDVVDTGRTDLPAMFTRIDWISALGATILTAIGVGVGLMMCILPGLVVVYLLWFVLPAIVDGESATGALDASYRFTTAKFGQVILFVLISVALALVGVISFGLGLIVATPVATIGTAYTWRVLQGRPVVPMT